MKNRAKINLYSLLWPRYWPAWLGVGLLWLLACLPYRRQLQAGAWLGTILYLFPTQLKQITMTNLNLCFPELTRQQRITFAKKNFVAVGIGLVEAAMAWWAPNKKLYPLYQINGLEHIEDALKQNKGVILVGPHFTCLEIVGRLIGIHYSFGVMYRPHKKPFIAFIHEHFRKQHYVNYIPRNRIHQLINALKNKMVIWYAYDIDGGEKNTVFAPFFGIPTASLTSVSRIAHLSHAAVIPIGFYRRDNHSGYDVTLLPALENFPTDDLMTDATRLNAILEQLIRIKPEQYIWQYKRFKTRPYGEKRFY